MGIDHCCTFENDHVRLTATRLERTNWVKWRDERPVCRVICYSDKLFRYTVRPTVSVSLQEFFLFSVLELYLYTGIVLHIRVNAHVRTHVHAHRVENGKQPNSLAQVVMVERYKSSYPCPRHDGV